MSVAKGQSGKDKLFRVCSFARTSDNSKRTQSLLYANEKSTLIKGCFSLAQRRGFEPPVSFRPTHDFQSCSLNHSDISAKLGAIFQTPIYITVFFEKMQAFLITLIKIFQKVLSLVAIARFSIRQKARIRTLFAGVLRRQIVFRDP